jgi:DNA-directed RNA polymerase sigma subunit (sigma70/sigma32)
MVWDGINDGQTLQQLADKLNVSRERVRQMYEYSQRKVKQSLLARKSNLLNAGLKQVYPKVDLQ